MIVSSVSRFVALTESRTKREIPGTLFIANMNSSSFTLLRTPLTGFVTVFFTDFLKMPVPARAYIKFVR